MAKFFNPFKTFFLVQFEKSELPFPEMANWMGQFNEIAVGLVLISFVVFPDKWHSKLRLPVFYIANSVLAFILLVSVYVHMHPAVPAEVLPMAIKPPVLSIVMLLMVAGNMYLFRNQEKRT